MDICLRQEVIAPCSNGWGRIIEMGQRVAKGDDALAMLRRKHFRKCGELTFIWE